LTPLLQTFFFVFFTLEAFFVFAFNELSDDAGWLHSSTTS
jgi:hypothetical protein